MDCNSGKNTIGDNIKYFREKAGISQSELARRIDRVPSLISQFESGKATPSWGTMEDIAHALFVRRVDLMDGPRVEYAVVSTDLEAEMLNTFRRLDKEKQEQLVRIARSL